MPEERARGSSAEVLTLAAAVMCSKYDDEAALRGPGSACSGRLCSIPEDGDPVSFAGSPSRDDLWVPVPSSSSTAASASCRQRGPVRGRDAARRGHRGDALLDEQRVFHRSPVSLDNGYKPVVLVGLRASSSSDESPSRLSLSASVEVGDAPGRGRRSLSLAMTILRRLAAFLGAVVGVGVVLFAVAVCTLLVRDRLWWR